jgi:hypothetical protein
VTPHPRDILVGAQAGAFVLPVCDHYSGAPARMRKSLQLQAELTAEAVTRIGGAAKLTEAEQRKAQRALVTNGLLKSSPKRSGSAGMTFELDLNLLTQRLLTHSEGLAALIQTNSDAEPKLNVLDLERRAQARASNRNATGRRA